MGKKITLPKEYRSKFEDTVFVSRYKDHSILILNKNEHSNLLASINALKGVEGGLKRFLEAGMIEVSIQNNAVEIPFDNWLKGDRRTFENIDNGTLVR